MAILKPTAQLYNSYWGVVTDSFAESAGLKFEDAFELCDIDWLKELVQRDLLGKILPNLAGYVNSDGHISETDSVPVLFNMVIGGVGDVFGLKKNIKNTLNSIQDRIINDSIPSKEKIAEEVYKRIMEYIKPGTIQGTGKN